MMKSFDTEWWHVLALDTEDNQRGQPWIINFFDGQDHHTFTGINCRDEAWNFLERWGKDDIWATNAEYDLVNLFGVYVGRLCTLQYVSAGFLRGSTKFGQRVLDTMRHWPASVKDMGEAIGLPKLEVDGEYLNVEYCQRDTEIVWRYVHAMLERYTELGLKLKSTLPSMALQLWQKIEGKQEVQLAEDEKEWLRHGYYGGRVECYRLGQVRGVVRCYDFNSLFPSCMVERDYPALSRLRFSPSVNLWTQHGMVDCTVDVPYQPYPPLPYHGAGELIYPYGELIGLWTVPELRHAVEHCGVKIKKVHRAFVTEEVCQPFNVYVQSCYQARLKATNKIDSTFWKLMLNSLYGKFAQHGGIECIYQDRQIILEGQASHVNVIWSAYVTAYARVKLHQALQTCKTVYYTDTDSLFTSDILQTGAKIGELKLEGTSDGMEIVGNKIYLFNKVAKAKGVPKKSAGDFIRTGRAIYRRPVRYRMSRHSLLRPNYWTEFDKTLDRCYTKRRVCVDGHTEPWTIHEYHRFKHGEG